MQKKLFIESNTKGKALKMLEGKTFSSPLTFLTELVQNAQRAECSNFHVSLNGNTITLSDDGVGLKNPQSLLTFDHSEWDSTDEGFGIGFWSILGIPNLETIKITSNEFVLETTRDEIIETLSFSVSKGEQFNGFKVELTSSYFEENQEKIRKNLKEELELMSFDSFLDNSFIEKRDLKNDFSGIFMKDYEHELFSARLIVSDRNYYYPKMYYEKRFVCHFFEADYVFGIIELKNPDLKEPDRKSLVDNDKSVQIEQEIKKCIKDLYKSFIQTILNDEDMKDSFSMAISYILSPKEYENILKMDSTLILRDDYFVEDEEQQSERNEEEYEEGYNDESHSDDFLENKQDVLKSMSTNKKGETVSLENYSTFQIEDISAKPYPKDTVFIKDFINSFNNLVYVKSSEIVDYEDAIALAKYHDIRVFVSKNELYENYLISMNIPHLRQLEGNITNEYEFLNEGLRTKKEATFINLLNPIIKKYNLPQNLFLISEIKKEMEVVINGKLISKQALVNTKNEINILAAVSSGKITFDRRALGLRNFNIKDGNLGINELRAIMYNVNTIAHELAHFIYNTVDNTKEHYRWENYLRQEIIELYCL